MYITINDILSKISQESIMERYFPYSIKKGKQYRNPFRNDRNPGCTFKYDRKGKLIFVDWSKRESYDCFKVCQLQNRLDNMREVLLKINRDFNQNPNSFKKKQNKSIFISDKPNFVKASNFTLKVEIFDKWTKNSLTYWWSYGFTEEDLNYFKVIPCYKAYLGDFKTWTYSLKEPMYRYDFKEGKQIYRPLSKKGRFTQNLPPNFLMGLEQLPDKGNILFITSSYKDVITLYKVGLNAVAPIGESGIIDPKLLDDLEKRFEKIVILFNNDEAGISGTEKLLKERPNYEYYFLSLKDPSDLVKERGYLELEKELEHYGARFLT